MAVADLQIIGIGETWYEVHRTGRNGQDHVTAEFVLCAANSDDACVDGLFEEKGTSQSIADFMMAHNNRVTDK